MLDIINHWCEYLNAICYWDRHFISSNGIFVFWTKSTTSLFSIRCFLVSIVELFVCRTAETLLNFSHFFLISFLAFFLFFFLFSCSFAFIRNSFGKCDDDETFHFLPDKQLTWTVILLRISKEFSFPWYEGKRRKRMKKKLEIKTMYAQVTEERKKRHVKTYSHKRTEKEEKKK